MWLHFLHKTQTFAPLCRIVPEDKNNACISIAICLFIRALFSLARTFSWKKKWKKGIQIIKSRAARLPFKVALTCMHTMRNINGREVSLNIKYSTCSDFTHFFGHSLDAKNRLLHSLNKTCMVCPTRKRHICTYYIFACMKYIVKWSKTHETWTKSVQM